MNHIEWKHSPAPVPYPEAIAAMEARVAGLIEGNQNEQVWLLEHLPLYTSGTSANQLDLLDNNRFPVYAAGRGGQYTYHGPGQRIAYVMLDLKRRNAMDVRAYVKTLEHWIIASLARVGVEGFTREGRVGVWTINRQGNEAKIAALGIRLRKWVTFHGIAINVNPDLSHYAGIVPCGINNFGVTSLHALGVEVSMDTLDDILRAEFNTLFI
jgi:lipoyl(octanoyl) transferase